MTPMRRREFLPLAFAQAAPDSVRFRPEIEPLAALIERTERDKIAEAVVARMRLGASYRQVMAALFLAGIRNVNPRPPGFALHCVFVMQAAHQLSLEAPPGQRLLPLFYALDLFKLSQERDAKQEKGDWSMRAMGRTLLAPSRAAAELTAAMDAWDPDRAERAVASLARSESAPSIFDLLWKYAARDFRNIGHKAIFAANAYRTLQTIGWQHAEPVLRSLVLGILDFEPSREMDGFDMAKQTWTANQRRVKDTFAKLPESWAGAPSDPAAVRTALRAMRTASPDDACAETASLVTKGRAGADSAWDAVHLAAAELALRSGPGNTIRGIHAVSAANGLHQAFLAANDPRDRLLLVLQAAGWMTQFRVSMEARPKDLRSHAIDEGGPRPVSFDAAMRMAFAKGDEVHYYKFLAALIEDSQLVSPEWRPRVASALPVYSKTEADKDYPPMERAREALRGLGAA